MILIKESLLSFEEKNPTLISYFQIARKYYNSFKTNPLYIIF